MEFRITRTSSINDEEKPCEEAYKKKIGSKEKWCIKINSLEELLEFSDKYDDIVLLNFGKIKMIEIYDDYRE